MKEDKDYECLKCGYTGNYWRFIDYTYSSEEKDEIPYFLCPVCYNFDDLDDLDENKSFREVK